MSAAEFKLPTELTLECINEAFKGIITMFMQSQESQSSSLTLLKKEIEEKPSLLDLVSTIAQRSPKAEVSVPYVDIYSVHGILKSITESMNCNLRTLSDNFTKQECMYEKLILKLGQTTRLLNKKNENIEKKLGSYLNYSQGYFTQNFAQNKINKIFQSWKKFSEQTKRTKFLLNKHLRKINKFSLAVHLSKWKNAVLII